MSAAIGGVTWDGVTGYIGFDAVGDVNKSEIFMKTTENFSGRLVYEKTQLLRYAPTHAVTE